MKAILAALSLKAAETQTTVSTAVGAVAGASVLALPPLHAAFYGAIGAVVGALSMALSLLLANESVSGAQIKRVVLQAVLSILIGMTGAYVLSDGIASILNSVFGSLFPSGLDASILRLIEFLIGLTMWRLVPAIMDRAVKEVSDRGSR